MYKFYIKTKSSLTLYVSPFTWAYKIGLNCQRSKENIGKLFYAACIITVLLVIVLQTQTNAIAKWLNTFCAYKYMHNTYARMKGIWLSVCVVNKIKNRYSHKGYYWCFKWLLATVLYTHSFMFLVLICKVLGFFRICTALWENGFLQ